MREKKYTGSALSPMLHSFPESAILGGGLARTLGITAASVTVHQFPDGATLVRVSPTVGTLAILVQSLHDPNAKLMETLLAADALRRAGAQLEFGRAFAESHPEIVRCGF